MQNTSVSGLPKTSHGVRFVLVYMSRSALITYDYKEPAHNMSKLTANEAPHKHASYHFGVSSELCLGIPGPARWSQLWGTSANSPSGLASDQRKAHRQRVRLWNLEPCVRSRCPRRTAGSLAPSVRLACRGFGPASAGTRYPSADLWYDLV